jgi:hypothetical protein
MLQKLVCREQKTQTRKLGTKYLRASEGSSEPMADLASVWLSGLWEVQSGEWSVNATKQRSVGQLLRTPRK